MGPRKGGKGSKIYVTELVIAINKQGLVPVRTRTPWETVENVSELLLWRRGQWVIDTPSPILVGWGLSIEATCIPSPCHSEVPSTQIEGAVIGSGLLKTTWGRNAETQLVPDEWCYQCPGNWAPASMRSQVGLGHKNCLPLLARDGGLEHGLSCLLKPWSWAVSLKLGIEGAQTTCGENVRKHYSRTKSGKKKKKRCLVTISRQRKEACWVTKLKNHCTSVEPEICFLTTSAIS